MTSALITAIVIFGGSLAVCAWVWLFESKEVEKVDISCSCGRLTARDVIICDRQGSTEWTELVAELNGQCLYCSCAEGRNQEPGSFLHVADYHGRRALTTRKRQLTTDNFPTDNYSPPEANRVH